MKNFPISTKKKARQKRILFAYERERNYVCIVRLTLDLFYDQHIPDMVVHFVCRLHQIAVYFRSADVISGCESVGGRLTRKDMFQKWVYKQLYMGLFPRSKCLTFSKPKNAKHDTSKMPN